MTNRYLMNVVDDGQRRVRLHWRCDNPSSLLRLLLGILMLVPGFAPIQDAHAEDVLPVIIDDGPVITGPINNDSFVTCNCSDGRQTLANGIEQCASACASLPPSTPVSVQSCSGTAGGVPLTNAERIVQCGPGTLFQGGLGTTEQAVLDNLIPREKGAVDAVLSAHQLPETDRDKVMGYARDSSRAFLFADLLSTIQKPDSERTLDDQRVVALYETVVREKRQDAADFALSEFHHWEAVVCNNFGTGYVPPLGFTYPSQGAGCTQIGQVFGGPQPPSSEEFIAYGTAHAYNKLNTDAQTAAVAVRTGRSIQLTKALVGAAAAGIATSLILVFSSLGPVIITAIAPFAFVPISGVLSAGVTTGVLITSATAIGGAVAVVIAAIAIAVLQGIAVFETAAIPGELQAQVDAAQESPDLRESIKSKEGIQELYGAFIESTMPDFPATAAPPAPAPSDRRFLVKDENGQKVGVFKSIGLQSPALPGINWEARLSGGWFVPRHSLADNSVIESLSLSLSYFDWDGNKRVAWRRGNQFVVTNLDATNINDAGVVTDEIKYKFFDGTKLIASIAVDDTPPVIEPQISGTPGNDGWYRSSVTLSWKITDAESAVSSTTGCNSVTIGGSGTTSHTCSATSEGGTGTASKTVKVDVTAPTIQASPAPAANSNGWNNTDVTVSFDCSDALSGVASCTGPKTLSTDGLNQSASGSATDKAGNTASTSVSSINVDKTAPVVAVTGVTNGASYTFGAVPAAGCATSDALSGVKAEAVIAVTGGTSNGVGSFTASCTGALDQAGNSGAANAVYQVEYPFSEFTGSVANPPSVNQVKAGAAVALKFSLGGDFGLDILAAGSPASQPMSCAGAEVGVGDLEPAVTAGSSGLTYDLLTGQYSYVWKTDKTWSGTCRQLVFRLDDGAAYRVNFKFK